jgi:hypothetical protein
MKAANLKAFNTGIAMAQADGLRLEACGLFYQQLLSKFGCELRRGDGVVFWGNRKVFI